VRSKRRRWPRAAAGLAALLVVGAAGAFGYQYFQQSQQAAQAKLAEAQARPLKLAELKKEQEKQPGRTFRDCAESPEMVVVPAGGFNMGDDTITNATPTHQVTIGQKFAVGKYPVTRDEYARFVKATRHSNDDWENPGISQTGRDPVVSVNWNDAKAHVKWLSTKTVKSYRLLSEAEYEYAERAGTTTKYWWGDDGDEACSHACYDRRACHHTATMPVGSYPANAFGLYDVAGNVLEWTEDCWNAGYAGAPDDGTTWTSGDCGPRDLRGGSWNDLDRAILQSAFRDGLNTGHRLTFVGFRVARTL